MAFDPHAGSYEIKKKFTQEEVIPAPDDIGALANRINKATHAIHNKINNLISLKMVFALRDPKIYRQGIIAFYYVFREFEHIWVEFLAQDPTTLTEDQREIQDILQQVWTPALARTEALELDLSFYYHTESAEAFAQKYQNPVMSEQISMLKHMKDVLHEKPYLILAYAHTLYLALFAGGRIMRSSVAKSTGLFPVVPGKTQEEVSANGTHLFKFPMVDDEDALRLDFKRRFELATRNSLSEEQKLEIIAESEEIFRRNIAAVDEVSRKNQRAIVQKFGYKATKFFSIILIIVSIFLLFLQMRKFFNF
ncbi:uncharacterized protein SAPINGB_P000972 [Magnusiomyces paraingens]|uniref:Heme oxygenase n=1 Tax=Magnusiomyces paraingens TaxID=2606893 RepID=A0A5E8B3Y0_9ASCO|nr:uncharacterized protein SAPINGB_P000972 [Saprochaete ingens]VVT45950.1 unnamed protein product [Saprochaete ingens]